MAGTTLFFWRQQNRIRIPIPKGQESIGQDLVDQLKEHNQRR
jgi:hypothetical protein